MGHDIVDNKNIKLAKELKDKLSVAKSAKFATGWFFLTGLRELQKEIDSLQELQILVGSKTNKQTAEVMLLAKRYEEAIRDSINRKKHIPQSEIKKILEEEFEALVSHISTLKPAEKNIEFVRWFWEKLREGKIKVRIYPHETLHAKLYLVNYKDPRHGPGMAFVGSSNLSMSGFNLNTELNVAVHGKENHQGLSKWFDEKWNKSERADFTALANRAIKKSWVMNDEVTPFRIYLRVLHEIFSYTDWKEIPETGYGEVELWPYQKDAVIDAYQRLHEYTGVFISDVPGLGKTYMGSALLAHLQEEGQKAIVICPPKLKEQWEEVLADFGVGTARVFSHGKLDQIINDEKLFERQIVLVDESHHFRNPETNRYKDMELICENKKVILVGATPQNLSVWDLYYQIKLFTDSQVNHKFRIDPIVLSEFFKEADKSKVDIENLINQIVIRRTRKDIKDFYGEDKLPDFPERVGPKRIDYSIDEVYPGGIYKKLNELIDKLRFARYDLGSFIDEEKFTPEERQRIKQAGKNLRKIMRMILFRRLESSIKAFQDSTDWMHKSHLAFLKALEQNKVLAGDAGEDVVDQLRGGVDLSDLEIPDEAYPAGNFEIGDLEKEIRKDEKIFKEMHMLVKGIEPEKDDKLQSLIKTLSTGAKDKKTIIFTQFTSTAEYLGKELSKHFEKVDYVSRSGGKVLTKAKRFSPKSNNFKVKTGEEIDILVSTEILSEGLNLQDGQVIINYELHWNPVRIIQRIGRIDRIGSKHDKIWVYNFFPQEEAEKEINVETKVKTRIDEIIRNFGADEKTITEDEKEARKKLFRIYTEDKRALEEEEIESKSAAFRREWLKLKEKYPKEYDAAKDLPEMITMGKTAKKKGVAVFARADDYFRLMFASKDGEILERNDWDILPLIACDKKIKAKETIKNHLSVIEKVRKNFEEEVNQREVRKTEYLEKIKTQIIDKLRKAKKGKPERFKKEVDEVIAAVHEAKLTVKDKRELRSVRKKHGFPPEDFSNEVKKIVEDSEKEAAKRPEKKYAQVIISESLV